MVLATVSLSPLATVAEGFGYGSTIAGLGGAMDTSFPNAVNGSIRQSLGVREAGKFTMEAWLFPKPDIQDGVVWNYSDAYRLTRVNDTGLRFSLIRSGSLGAVNMDVTIPNVLHREAWNHIATTYDGNSLQVFVNGVNVSTTSAASNSVTTPELFPISHAYFKSTNSSSDSQRGAGAIDEVRVWNVARTQEEIQEAMLSQLDSEEAGLVAYWTFDNPKPDDSYVELDSTTNGNWINVSGPGRILNASPQIGFVDVTVDSAVTNPVGLWVSYAVTSGTATADIDFFGSTFRKSATDPASEVNGIIIPFGQSAGRIYFTARHDAIFDPNEFFSITLQPYSFSGSSASDYTIGLAKSATITIVDSGEFKPGLALTDPTGRPITSSSPLFVDPVTRATSFQVQLTSQPRFTQTLLQNAVITVTATPQASVDIGQDASQQVQLTFTDQNWYVPQTVRLVRALGNGSITFTNTFPLIAYLPQVVTAPFTLTPQTDARVEEGSVVDVAALKPTVNLTTIKSLLENDDQPGRIRVQLNTPAPKGGIDVFYSVTSNAREGVDFKTLPGVIHVAEGLLEADIPIYSIDNHKVTKVRNIYVTLGARQTYTVGSQSTARMDYVDDDIARIVISNPITFDITTPKSLARPLASVDEGANRYALADNSLPSIGKVGTFDSPSWTATGGLGASFTQGKFDTDSIAFSLTATADPTAKISVRLQPTEANGQPQIRLRKSGADEINSVSTASMFDSVSGVGTRLMGGGLSSPKLPTLVSDDTLEWSLAGLPAGDYRLVLATNSNVRGFLAAIEGFTGVSYDYEAKFTSSPVAPYTIFSTNTVTNYTSNYSTLITNEPAPVVPIAAEPNNTIGTAFSLGTVTADYLVSSQTIDSSADDDYFKFVLDAASGRPDTLTAVFNRPSGSPNPLIVDLLSASGSVLLAGAARAQNQYINLSGLADGTYLIRVKAANSSIATTDYALKFRTIVNPSEPEGNDTMDTATYIGVVTDGERFNDFSLTKNEDRDFYRFTLNNSIGRPANVNVLSTAADGNLFVGLYNATSQTLVATTPSTGDTKNIPLANLADGDYVLRIEGENTGYLNRYNIAFGLIKPRQRDLNPNQFAVRLDAQPASNVTVALSSGNSTQGRFSSSSLLFTPSNWNQFQNVTVTPLDDGVFNGDVTYTVQATASTNDPLFQNHLTTFKITNIDRGNFVQPDEVGTTDESSAPVVTISSLPKTAVNEASNWTAFRIELSKASTSAIDVTLDFSRSTAVEGVNFRLLDATSGSPHKIRFPAGTTRKDITLAILDDQVQFSAGASKLVIRATVLDDDGYRPANTSDPGYSTAVEIADINTAGFDVRNASNQPSGSAIASTSEDQRGAASVQTIRLISKPKTDVIVYIASSDSTEALLQTDPAKVGSESIQLKFTPANWNQFQTFYIKGVDDLLDDGTTSFRFVVSARGEDDVYRGLTPLNFNGRNLDDDTAGLTVTSPQATVAGRTNVFSVKLNTQPLGEVRVTMTPRNDQVAINESRGGDPATLVFNSFNWNIPQLVKVIAVDDKIVEFIHQSEIDFRIESGRQLRGLTTADNRTSATAVDLGDVTGGLSWNSLTMNRQATTPFLADQWYKFTLSGPSSSASVIRLRPEGQNQVSIPNVYLFNSKQTFLNKGQRTEATFNGVGDVTIPASSRLPLDLLPAGTYYIRLEGLVGMSPTSQFGLWIDDGDRSFDSVSVPSVSVSIKDNDLPIAEILAGPTASEVFSEPSRFTIRLNTPAPSGPADTGIRVNFKVSGGRATQGTRTSTEHDYTIVADQFNPATGEGWVRIAPGDIQANIGIVPVDDKLVEDVPLRLQNFNSVANNNTGTIVARRLLSDRERQGTLESEISLGSNSVLLGKTSLGLEVSFTITSPSKLVLNADRTAYVGTIGVTVQLSDLAAIRQQGSVEFSGRVKSENVEISLLGGTDYVLPLAPSKQNAQSTDPASLDLARVVANMTIFDDDVPGVRVIEVNDHTTLSEGSVTTFQVSLLSEPRDEVKLTLTPGAGLTFVNPIASTSTTVAVRQYDMVATNLDKNIELTFISLDETDKGFTATIDARMTRATLGSTPKKSLLQFSSSSDQVLGSVVFDIPAANAVDFAGNPVDGRFDTVQRASLSGLQRLEDGSFAAKWTFNGQTNSLRFTPKASLAVPVQTTVLTFKPSEWYKTQTVTIRARNDGLAQPGSWYKDTIAYTVTSNDAVWNQTPVPDQAIHIQDLQLDVGNTVDGIQGAFGSLEDSLLGLKVPLIGTVGSLPGVGDLFHKAESPLVKSIAAQESLSVSTLDEIAESSLNPLVASGIFDSIEVTPSADPDEVKIAIHLEKLLHIGSVSLDASLGLDALGIQFSTTGSASVDFNFSMDLAFGWHRQFGFFLDTSLTGLHMGAKLSLVGSGATADNPANLFTGQGSFGFLQLKFNDDPSNPSELAITFDARLEDLDNINTTRFFDINGDGILADTPITYPVGLDQNKDGLIDRDADGNPLMTQTTTAAVEPFQTIGAKGPTSLFPTVAQIAAANTNVKGAAQANWNTIGGKTTTFDESESTQNEGIYQVVSKGTQNLVFLDLNRDGKLDIGARNIDPFTKAWTTLDATQRQSSEVWFLTTTPQRIRELRILSKGTGNTLEYYLDINQNALADANEKITTKLWKKLDKDGSKVLEADFRQDGEGTYLQGTSTAFFDTNTNGRQDFDEPFISYSFDSFQLNTNLVVEDDAQKLFFDFNANGLYDLDEVRVGESADRYFLDFNANSLMEDSEPRTQKSTESFEILQSVINTTTNRAIFGNYSAKAFVRDGERFIDFNGDGELTRNDQGEAMEPHASQRTELNDFDLNRFVLRLDAVAPTLFSSVAAFVTKLKNSQTLLPSEQTAIRNRYDALVIAKSVVEQPSDGNRLTLAELNAFRAAIAGANTTKSSQVKAAAAELFLYSFQGYANVGFNTRTSINDSSIMPAIQFDLAVTIPLFNLSDDAEANDNGFSVEFRNVALDLGSFLKNYMVPILATANDAIAPVKPIINALNADTKLLGKLGLASAFESDGKPGISLLEIAKKLNTGGSAQAAKIDRAIKFADQITTLVNTIDTLSQTVADEASLLQFGDFSLSDLRAASGDPANSTKQARVVARADGAQRTSASLPRTTADDVEAQAKKSSKFKDKYNALKKVDGLTIQLFDPNTLLSLIMGESNVNLVTYDIPDIDFAFNIEKQFRIWGPIAGKLQGGFSVSTDLSMGFDTKGLEEWAAHGYAPNKSYLVFDGIYLNDWNSGGTDKDELTIRAFVSAGVGIDIGIASGFVKGGVEGIVGFDLVDVGERSGSSDGKIRGSDIIEKLSTRPSDLFDLTGTVNAFLAAEVKVNLLFFKKTVYNNRLATFELARFKIGDSGGRTSLGGKVQTGPIVGGIVWFDANNNFVRDEDEPFTETDEDGYYSLEVPDDADLKTGTVRVEGGRDGSTGVANHADVMIPHGSKGNATGWTALEEALVTDGGMTTPESQALIETAFGIDPTINLSTFSHLDEALAGNVKAGPVLLGENLVNTVAIQLVAVLEGASDTGLDDKRYTGLFSEAVYIAMARQLRKGSLDLAVRTQLEQILLTSVEVANQLLADNRYSARVDVARIAKLQSEILTVVQATIQNEKTLALRATNVIDLAHRVTQEKVMANGKAAEDLYQMLRLLKSPNDVLREDARTDNAYLQSIEQIKLPPLVSAIADVHTFEDQTIPAFPLIVRRQSSGAGEVKVSVNSDNAKLLPASSVSVTQIQNDALKTEFRIQVTPKAYQFGVAHITLHVVDTMGSATDETFTVDVGWLDHAPEAKSDSFRGFVGKSTRIDPLANDLDRDGDPMHLSLLSVPSDGQTVLNTDGTITYTASSSASGRRTFKYQVDDGNGGFSVATATLDLVYPTADLVVTQSTSPFITAGHEIAFQITVTNNGPETSEGIVITDPIPFGAVFASATAPVGFAMVTPAVNTRGNVVFTGGSLAAGQSATFVVFAKVPESLTAITTIVNLAEAKSTTNDPNPGNNSGESRSVVNMIGAALAPSLAVGKTDLIVSGSSNSEFILVRQGVQGFVYAEIAGKTFGPFSPSGRIIVYAGAGHDTILVDGTVTREVISYGDDGNDVMYGSKVGGVMVGGLGNDTLMAKGGRSLQIGGLGIDTLDGVLGENILIAGYTKYDSHERALTAILNEWNSGRTYDQRTASIAQGLGGLNAGYSLSQASVFDDDVLDILLGGLGLDWYFSHELGNRRDTVSGRRSNEKTTRI
jgi:uncharacterized repeat protein (TIGR01451 family)